MVSDIHTQLTKRDCFVALKIRKGSMVLEVDEYALVSIWKQACQAMSNYAEDCPMDVLRPLSFVPLAMHDELMRRQIGVVLGTALRLVNDSRLREESVHGTQLESMRNLRTKVFG
ncbi:uncharacterized protein G2W53_028591 [Senna tora]|uniref:Uncharacterized protein n=1 Tax=Senna tora TaxID=362788 RepID=A0A834T688_9FABA|nr:uncharacterized protein G2W53_028591 [Senna tora]